MNKEKIVGHVPKNINVWVAMFLKLMNSSIASRVTGEKVNRGGGDGLEKKVRGELWTGFCKRLRKKKNYAKI